ncbi:hypothetical protein GGD66_002364 [Bradyrhizobium sp. CIR48]|nr:hypothetical protein [Bradyrhizobium sp. CIR48]
MLRREPRCATRPIGAMHCSDHAAARPSSLPNRGGRLLHQYVHRVFRRLSTEIGLRRPVIVPGHVCTTSVTTSPSGPSSTGIAKARTLSSNSQCCPLTSATPACAILTGISRLARADGRSGAASQSAMGGDAMKPACNVATLIERFFTDRLMRQRNVSGNTIASYRGSSGCCSCSHRCGCGSPHRP